MNFYKLSREEYKKVSKDFRQTYIGGRIYSYVFMFSLLLLLVVGANAIMTVYMESYAETAELVNKDNIELIQWVVIFVFILFTIISYHFYINHLKKYYDENHGKNKK